MSTCCAPKTPFVPEQVLKAVDQIEKLCAKRPATSPSAPSLQEDTDFGLTIEMSTDGNTLVIGADFYDAKDAQGVEQENSGAVFVFKRKESFAACKTAKQSEEKYKLQQILVATDPKTGANQVQTSAAFGRTLSVSGSGSRIVVGALFEDIDNVTDVGAVYVFDQQSKSLLYKAVQKIVPAKPFVANTLFGDQVALSKDGRVLFVADDFFVEQAQQQIFYYEDCAFDFSTDCFQSSQQNKGFVLKQSVNAQQIVQGTEIPAENVLLIGVRLKLSENGNTGVISTPFSAVVDDANEEVSEAGFVFVVQRFIDHKCPTGVTEWTTTQVLTSKSPQASANFGLSVAMTPDAQFIAVEEPGRDKGQSPSVVQNVGLVSVFEKACKSALYKMVAELCPTGEDIEDSTNFFTKSVVISDDGCTIAVGYELSTVSGARNAGVVVTYQRRCGSSEWTQTQVLSAFPSAEEEQTFGSGLAMSGDANSLVVGAQLDNSNDFVYTFSSRFARAH